MGTHSLSQFSKNGLKKKFNQFSEEIKFEVF